MLNTDMVDVHTKSNHAMTLSLSKNMMVFDSPRYLSHSFHSFVFAMK
jgi:hypothetical protein